MVLFSFVCEDGIPTSYAVPEASLPRPLAEIKAQFKLNPNKWDYYNAETLAVDNSSSNRVWLQTVLEKAKGAVGFTEADGFEASANQKVVHSFVVRNWC